MIYGERVKQIRELLGMTQTELAAQCNVTQPLIAHIEGGRAMPSDSFIQGLSLQTGFPVTFFRQLPRGDFPMGSLLFRARACMTERQLREMYRYGEAVFEIASRLLPQIKPIPLRVPTGLGVEPKIAAALCRSELGLPPDTPMKNVTLALEKGGILVLAIPKRFEDRDAFSLWTGAENRRPMIIVGTGNAPDRLRFSLCHELGHLVMHQPAEGLVADIEREAHQFAAEFLLPEAAITQDLVPPYSLDLFAVLKRRWGVSIQALIRRARDLDILTLRQYKYLFQKLSVRGWRKSEPVVIPLERPRALRQMAEILYGLPIDYARLASDVRMSEKFVRQVIEVHAAKTATPALSQSRSNVIVFSKRA